MRAMLVLCVAGCALTSKAEPIQIRYFSPTRAEVQRTVPAPSPGRARLGQVSASSHLRYRIAHRRSPVELELADALRWTEEPEEYVRRSLSDALFVERAVQQVVSGESFTINVEVTAFEHVERAGRHYGYVQLRYEVDDDQSIVAADIVAVERESESADITRVVGAISAALSAASAEAADRIVSGMRQAP